MNLAGALDIRNLKEYGTEKLVPTKWKREEFVPVQLKGTRLTIADTLALNAVGTADGAKKGWDTRGRGRKAVETAPKKVSSMEKSMENPERGALLIEHANLKKQYEAFGRQIDALGRKLENPEAVKSVAGKFLHFLKNLGDWGRAAADIRDLALTAAGVVYAAMHVSAASVHGALMWALIHVGPVFTSMMR